MRNREINSTTENIPMGITVRKKVILKSLEYENSKSESKKEQLVFEKNLQSHFKEVAKQEPKPSSYENLSKYPIIWPRHSEIVDKEQKQSILDNIIARRNIIRMHFNEVENGIPSWFLTRKLLNSEFINPEYLANIIDYLNEQDISCDPLGRDFLEGSLKVKFRARYIFINWLVSTHLQFSMISDTLYLAIALSDRFIKANKTKIIETDLIIIGVVCLFIAAKIEELQPPHISEMLALYELEHTHDFCHQLEIQILRTVNFQLSIPVPIFFIRHYNIIINNNKLSQNLSRYFCELSLQDYEACSQSSNMIGASCVFLSEVITQNITANFSDIWNPKLQAASGLVYEDFQDLVKNLCVLVQKQATPSSFRAITEKYSCVGFMFAPREALNSNAFKSIFLHFRNQIKTCQ